MAGTINTRRSLLQRVLDSEQQPSPPYPISTPRLYIRVDCSAVLSEWSSLRCRALLPARGMGDTQREAAIIDHDSQAWEKFIPATDTAETAKTAQEAPAASSRYEADKGN